MEEIKNQNPQDNQGGDDLKTYIENTLPYYEIRPEDVSALEKMQNILESFLPITLVRPEVFSFAGGMKEYVNICKVALEHQKLGQAESEGLSKPVGELSSEEFLERLRQFYLELESQQKSKQPQNDRDIQNQELTPKQLADHLRGQGVKPGQIMLTLKKIWNLSMRRCVLSPKGYNLR